MDRDEQPRSAYKQIQEALRQALGWLERQPRPKRALDEAMDLLAVGAAKAEAAAGGRKLLHLRQREMLSMLHRDSHSPAVRPAPTPAFSGSSCVGNTPVLENSVVSWYNKAAIASSGGPLHAGSPAEYNSHDKGEKRGRPTVIFPGK